MSNAKLYIPRAEDLQKQAVEWIIDQHLSESWSNEDQGRLSAWLDQSPAHLVAYWRAKDGWSRTELLGALSSIRPQASTSGSSRPWGLWSRRAAAAAMLLVAGVAAFNYFSRLTEHRYATALGGRETLTLVDGSRIELNTNTSLRIGEARGQRTVTMDKGEAFFQIRHDSSHPFVVNVAGRRVIDVGTKFSILANGQDVQVALVEGLARLEGAHQNGVNTSILLRPGDVATATDHSLSIAKRSQPQLENQLAWRRGVLVFDNTPLSEVAAEFNRYNQQKIVIADRTVERQTINGAFQANDLQAMTNVAREVFGLRVERRNDEIRITR